MKDGLLPLSAPVRPDKTRGTKGHGFDRCAKAEQAGKNGAEFFGIVTSGKRVRSKKEWSEIFKAVERVSGMGIHPCASLELLDEDRGL